MPEYLAPGVFIEEVPPRLRAIEGVSTSTAGFVGPARRGPTAGFDPFTRPFANGFTATLDPTPVFVSSFAEAARQFGNPPQNPDEQGFLLHALQGFFANGGKRCYVARVVHNDALASSQRVDHGVRLRLTARPAVGATDLFLNSLRGLGTGANPDIEFHRVSDDGLALALDLAAVNPLAGSVTAAAPLTQAQVDALDPAGVYAVPAGTATAPTGVGPDFIARSPGVWGDKVNVRILASDRPPVQVTTAANASNVVQVASIGAFYVGAIVAVHAAGAAQALVTVSELLPGRQLRLSANVTVAVNDVLRLLEIDVEVQDLGTGAVEVFRGLTWNDVNIGAVRRRHYATVVNARSRLVWVQPPWAGLGGGETPTLADMPATNRADLVPLGGGADGTLADDADVIGNDAGPGNRTGIPALQDADDISIIAAPGYTATAVQLALIAQCERLRYRFAVLDGERDPAGASVTSIIAHRNVYDTSYAAYYVPWLEQQVGEVLYTLPPSGHVIGVYARTDVDRGVWKAPANEVVRVVTGLRSAITTPEQELLNPRGINAIRRFEGRGIRVWGARTLSSDASVKYVNVRRFLIFLEASLDRGTQWVVFEPNDPKTWARVVDSVSAFLHTQWRSGALFGRRPEDSYFVRCDETTMTADDVQNGRLICDIGVAINRPAEFVIFRIEQITGFAG